MSDRLLSRYTRSDLPAGDAQAGEGEIADDLGCFGWLRGIKERAIMLELRRKSGLIVAIGYSWIERVEYDPSEGITLTATGRRIKIKGRNFNAEVRPRVCLFEGIIHHKISWIRESDIASSTRADPSATVVETIEV